MRRITASLPAVLYCLLRRDIIGIVALWEEQKKKSARDNDVRRFFFPLRKMEMVRAIRGRLSVEIRIK